MLVNECAPLINVEMHRIKAKFKSELVCIFY